MKNAGARALASAAFAAFRSSGHSGSRWLAELLGSQPDISIFFEFAGFCPSQLSSSPTSEEVARLRRQGLTHFYADACRCKLDAAHSSCSLLGAGPACNKNAWCNGRCPARAPGDCATAVGLVEDYSPEVLREMEEYARNESSRRRVAVVGFERDNAVKHAYSLFVKTKCMHTSIHRNHGTGSSGGRGSSGGGAAGGGNGGDDGGRTSGGGSIQPLAHTFVWVAPERLLVAARELTLRRRSMARELRGSAFARDGAYVALHYEQLQMAPERELARVLPQLGVARGLDAPALRRVSLAKSGAEDLSTVLLNVDELDAALGSWPCLRRMLRSPAPEAFAEECTQAEHERHSDLALAPPAKGRGDVLRCEAAAGSATACALVARGGVRLGANASTTSCSAWHRSLCAQAMRRARELHPRASPEAKDSSVEICVLPNEASDSDGATHRQTSR